MQSSVGIACFTTAYARIAAHKIKALYPENLYYSDTDSFVLDCKLPEHVLSQTKLGLLKLEHEISSGIFPLDKCYMLNVVEGPPVRKFKGIPARYVRDEFYRELYEGRSVAVNSTRFELQAKNAVYINDCKLVISPPRGRKRAMIHDSNGH